MNKDVDPKDSEKLSVKEISFTNKYDDIHKRDFGMKEALNFLGWKLFRKKENELKMQFILDNSDVDFSLFGSSHALSKPNFYHNFGHQIGVAESVIKFALAEGLDRGKINLLVVAALVHDSGHAGTANIDDEMKSVELSIRFLPEELCKKLGFTHEQLKNVILATTFSQRGRYAKNLANIIQDADIGNVSFGPHYRLYCSMGLADEFGVDCHTFIHVEQQKFVNYLKFINPEIFLSDGAKKVGIDLQQSLDTILSWPDAVIDYAYKVKNDDILFENFKKHIDDIIQYMQ